MHRQSAVELEYSVVALSQEFGTRGFGASSAVMSFDQTKNKTVMRFFVATMFAMSVSRREFHWK